MGIDERLHHLFAADPGVKVHLYGKQVRPGRKIGHVTVLGEDLDDGARAGPRAAAHWLQEGERVSMPVVGVIMGSDSDWPTMEAAAEALDEFGVAVRGRRGLGAPHARQDDRLRPAPRPTAASR